MSEAVVEGAMVECLFGKIPVPLVVIPEGSVITAGELPMATILNIAPEVNIPSFGTCTSPTNPACYNPSAQGPCVPVIVDPWIPGAPTVLVNEIPALTQTSRCSCMLGAPMCIGIVEPGQFNVMLPD